MTHFVLLLVLGCQPDPTPTDSLPPRDTSARWEPLSEEDLDAGKDDTGDQTDTGDKDDACGPQVVLDAACEGDWTSTLCVDEHGEYWWCEDGIWTTGK